MLARVRWAVPVLLFAALPLLSPGQQPTGKRYAVLVGVNIYDSEQKLVTLKYAVNDVTVLADVLRKGGYEVILLTDDTQEKPTKKVIETAVNNVRRAAGKADTLVLAFAGHGLQFEGQSDAYFCPKDAVPFADETATLVSMTKIYNELDKSNAGVKVLLVDACRDDPNAGRGSRGVDADKAPPPPRGVAALFSCSAGERAFEHDKFKHGVFFHHVLQGLGGNAKDEDGEVTFFSLANYVSKRVSKDVPAVIGGGARQSPNTKGNLSGASPVLLAGFAIPNPVPSVMPQDRVQIPGTTDTPEPSPRQEQAGKQLFFRGSTYRWGIKVEKLRTNGLVDWSHEEESNIRDLITDGRTDALFGITKDCVFKLNLKTGQVVERKERDNQPSFVKLEKSTDDSINIVLYDGNRIDVVTFLSKSNESSETSHNLQSHDSRRISDNELPSKSLDLDNEFADKIESFDEIKAKAIKKEASYQCRLGQCYADGNGVTKNEKEAIKWYSKAAEQGNEEGICHLGIAYYHGRGVAKDYDAAFNLLSRIEVDRVLAPWKQEAINLLGDCYYYGRGVRKNPARAVETYRVIAGGDKELGFLYAGGDKELGFLYAGYPAAQYSLGYCLAYGEGVVKNIEEAKKWLKIAAEAGHEAAKKELIKIDPSAQLNIDKPPVFEK